MLIQVGSVIDDKSNLNALRGKLCVSKIDYKNRRIDFLDFYKVSLGLTFDDFHGLTNNQYTIVDFNFMDEINSSKLSSLTNGLFNVKTTSQSDDIIIFSGDWIKIKPTPENLDLVFSIAENLDKLELNALCTKTFRNGN